MGNTNETNETNDFDVKLEKHFEDWFTYELRNLRGTEVEITNMKASAHKWYFAGAGEMRRIFQTVMMQQYRQWADELNTTRLP